MVVSENSLTTTTTNTTTNTTHNTTQHNTKQHTIQTRKEYNTMIIANKFLIEHNKGIGNYIKFGEHFRIASKVGKCIFKTRNIVIMLISN